MTIRLIFGETNIDEGKELINQLIKIMKMGNTFFIKSKINQNEITNIMIIKNILIKYLIKQMIIH